jgi:uncharacterized protein YoxC
LQHPKQKHSNWPTFLAGVLVGASIFQPASGLNKYAMDNLDSTRAALEKQLDTIKRNRDELTLRREELINEFNRKIDSLAEYEKQLEDALRDVEDAMRH